MNPTTSQPPPVPCPKCGGQLAAHGAYQFKCESCGATRRRKPGEAEAATLVMVKKHAGSLPKASGLSVEEQIALEQTNVQKCLAYAQARLL